MSELAGILKLARFGESIEGWLRDSLRAKVFAGGVLMALVGIAYAPVWNAGFIWDDDAHLTENPCIVGPLGFWDIWTTEQARICPLTLSTFSLEYQFFGLNPRHIMSSTFRFCRERCSALACPRQVRCSLGLDGSGVVGDTSGPG